jgi:hypothetical protein
MKNSGIVSAGHGSFEAVLAQLGLVNCLKHLTKINVATLEDFQATSKHAIKTLGFKPEVQSKLLRLLVRNETLDGDRRELEQVRFVTLDEEEEAQLLEAAVAPLQSTGKKNCSQKVAKQAGSTVGPDGNLRRISSTVTDETVF